MRMAICDDEPLWIKSLEKHIMEFKKSHNEIDYDIFTSGEELLNQYNANGNIYDIVILDIEMKNISGIETAQIIRNMDNSVIIFFLTSYKEYVFECFRPSPMNFWVKPVSYKLFIEDMNRAYKRIEEKNLSIKIIENRKKVRIRCDDIIYIENKDRKSWIHTVTGIHKVNKLLSDFCKDLDNNIFVRVYKSFIINLRYIHVIGESTLSLYESSETIPLSRTYKHNLINKYINLKEKENF